jgi:uncharacterized protein YukE
MSDVIDVDVVYSKFKASYAVSEIKAAIRSTEDELNRRSAREAELAADWSGYAKEWFDQRSASFHVVAETVIQQLRDLIRQIENQVAAAEREQSRRVGIRQERIREALRREEAARQQQEVLRQRQEAARQEAERLTQQQTATR